MGAVLKARVARQSVVLFSDRPYPSYSCVRDPHGSMMHSPSLPVVSLGVFAVVWRGLAEKVVNHVQLPAISHLKRHQSRNKHQNSLQ